MILLLTLVFFVYFLPKGPPGQVLGFQRFTQNDDFDQVIFQMFELSFSVYYTIFFFLHYDCLVSSQAIQNIKSLLYVSSTVEKYKSPLGTRDNPATSCKDLMYSDNYQDGG